VKALLFDVYKADPRTDLRGAQEAGLRTGYVPRPLEWGSAGPQPPSPDPTFDVVAPDFLALADALGVAG